MKRTKRPFPAGLHDYAIRHGDYSATIRASDNGTKFKVYAVYGDITRLDDLKAAIISLLASRNAGERQITVTL